ncbi:MAG: polysaccharide pyruvyl transferase family protein [Rikenellaceae bacterium]|nr:polysaccharide pyruvyl transferase family protein [Rikenellaceae bacterium]
MNILYDAGIYLMVFGIRIASLFNRKAALWITGRRNIIRNFKDSIGADERVIWFHAASLGEFEQGRPVIEAVKERYPCHKILLTFFSPSGYEAAKNYKVADYIFYLPADTSRNARRFINTVNPETAVFIKYEFWANYLKYLRRHGTKTYVISATFRPDSAFFKWYGGRYRKLLSYFDWLFVQDDGSERLLKKIGIKNVSVSGDTRFDRVEEIKSAVFDIPAIARFKDGGKIFIAGSTWKEDEEVLVKIIDGNPDMKFIIVPHEIGADHVSWLCSKIDNAILYTDLSGDKILEADVLIVDVMGLLSKLYRYGDFAYVGGGFGAGIHNILEPAVYGLPLAFGPNYSKFNEAKDLLRSGGAVCVNNEAELDSWLRMLKKDTVLYDEVSGICEGYVRSNTGATKTIMDKI